jgi:hypothetical protein
MIRKNERQNVDGADATRRRSVTADRAASRPGPFAGSAEAARQEWPTLYKSENMRLLANHTLDVVNIIHHY